MKAALAVGLLAALAVTAQAQSPDTVWVRRLDPERSGEIADPAGIALTPAGDVIVGVSSNIGREFDEVGVLRYSPEGESIRFSLAAGPQGGLLYAVDIDVDDAGNACVISENYLRGRCGFCATKFDSAGEVLWTSRYASSGDGAEYPYALAPDGAGGLYAVGEYYDLERLRLFTSVKFDSTGHVAWVRTLSPGDTMYGAAYDVAVDRTGHAYVVGYGRPFSNWDFCCLTAKYAPDGTTDWVRVWQGPVGQNELGWRIACDGNGDIIVAAAVSDSTGQRTSVMLKYSAAGELLWSTPVAGSGIPADLKLDQSGAAYLAGTDGGPDSYISISKVSPTGDTVWTRACDAGRTDKARRLALGPEGNVYVAGTSDQQMLTVKYTTNGDHVWTARFSGPGGEDYPFGVAANDTGVYVTALSRVNTSRFGTATVRYALNSGVSMEAPSDVKQSTAPTILPAPELARFEGTILDIQGRDVTDRRHALSPGVYFCRPATDPASFVRKVVIAR